MAAKKRLEQLRRELRAPIIHDGKQIKAVTLTEPLAHQVAKAAHKSGDDASALAMRLFEEISDLPEGAAAGLKLRDFAAISQWLEGLNSFALALDHAAGLATHLEARLDDLEGERSFALCVPVAGEGGDITTLTATEPSMDAMMMAMQRPTSADQMIALVAGATGQTIPVISQLAQRDLNRIGTWLGPFTSALGTAPDGGT